MCAEECVSCHPCYSGQSCDYDVNPVTVINFINFFIIFDTAFNYILFWTKPFLMSLL